MGDELTPDLCVIGAGAAGLSVAAAAAQLGVPVVLIEKDRMGGDCLNHGCVPSKALLAAAGRAQAMRDPRAFGVRGVIPDIDHRAVHRHVRQVIDAIAPNDSEERFAGMGVRVIRAEARFLDKRTLEAGEQRIRARRFVIATGSSPAVPPIPGLDAVPWFTNETIFDIDRPLPHLLIVGAGPIGIEMAQAWRRLGSEVTVLEMKTPLAHDDPELAAVVVRRLEAEGVRILAGVRIERLERSRTGVRAIVDDGGGERAVEGSHLLLAAGRRPDLDGLGLEAAGIAHDGAGIKVSRGLKTSNRRVYAIGDVAGSLQFTHMGNYHAGLVIRNAVFRLPVKVSTRAIPWVTYTDPELAHVGLTEAQARERKMKFDILRWPYAENDRAQAERATEGFIKVVAARNGRILGASIVGESAGELIHLWVLAISKRMKIGDLTSITLPYPTLGEISRRAAYTWYLPKLSSRWLRRIIRFLRKFG